MVSLIGAIVSVPAAAFLGFALGFYPSRMECTQETLGSGCYEGELLMAVLAFGVLFLPFFLPSLMMSLSAHSGPRRLSSWWPLIVLCAVPLTVVVVAALSALTDPNAYF
ncbi:Na+/proline symporter [Arthrobacter bambusae]|uniref:Na+/proline symporter n=1 Tax=Arthrobacter bambusae TaxID=1338426 RepID=A0ABV2P8E8_9MICC